MLCWDSPTKWVTAFNLHKTCKASVNSLGCGNSQPVMAAGLLAWFDSASYCF